MKNPLSNDVLLSKENKSGKLSFLKVRILKNGEFSLVDVETNAEFIFQKEHLEEMVARGHFRVKEQHKRNKLKELDSLPPIKLKKTHDEQKRRLKYVKGVLNTGIPLGSPQKFESYISIKSIEIKDRNPPSAVSLYRWVKKYVAADGDPASLIPGYRKSGNRAPRVSPEHNQFINTVLDTVVEQQKICIVYQIYLNEVSKYNEQRVGNGLERINPVSQESIRKRWRKRVSSSNLMILHK
ncbi:hypothetical protein [Photobacterium leiognathi]|uniref:hypothetical protein n=1 Tax=Photobacterium leiognathi TaxID=553611 RepID=UPI00298103CB|nr:hypothetical protein [Photobacterium leiognathi]